MRINLPGLVIILLTVAFCFSSVTRAEAPDTAMLLLQVMNAPAAEKAALLNSLAEAYLPGDPVNTVKYASQAEDLASKYGQPAQLSRAFHSRADALFYLDEMEQAASYYLRSSEIEKQLHGEESDEYAARLGEIANCYDLAGYYETALSYYQQALVIAIKNENKPEMAANLANIGRLQTLRGNFGEAIHCMQQALQIDEKGGNDEVVATDLNTIGRIYQSWGKGNEALDYLLRAMDIDMKAGRMAKVAIRFNSMGLVYLDQQAYDLAIQAYQKALEIDRREGNEEQVGIRLSNLGTVYSRIEQYEKAISHLHQAEEIFIRHNMPTDLAGATYQLGIAFQKSGDPASAEKYLKQSRDIAEQNQLNPQLMMSLLGLSRFCEASGRYRDALEYHLHYSGLREKVFSEGSDRRLSEFRVMYETEKTRQQAGILARDVEIRKKKQLLTLVIGGLLVLVLLLGIAFMRLIALSHKRKKEFAEHKALMLNDELDLRNRELTRHALDIIKSNEHMSRFIESMELALKGGESQDQLRALLESIRNGERDHGWKEFDMRFTQVHQDFYNKLEVQFPDLSPNERKLCAFLKLNMTSKDIASITHQSIHSIEVARTRLRKKLNLTGSDENLVAFLAKR